VQSRTKRAIAGGLPCQQPDLLERYPAVAEGEQLVCQRGRPSSPLSACGHSRFDRIDQGGEGRQAALLAPTPWIDSAHPAIVRLAQELTRGAHSEVEAAVRLHDAVRDRVLFGIAPGFYAMKASEVLEAGVGYCNTKTTLFSALLRARGIATRTRMFDLSSAVLSGLFDTGTARVDHAVTEVWLKGRWWGVDSDVVDLPLERAAGARWQARRLRRAQPWRQCLGRRVASAHPVRRIRRPARLDRPRPWSLRGRGRLLRPHAIRAQPADDDQPRVHPAGGGPYQPPDQRGPRRSQGGLSG
jgi:transglutaminase-like putative cysteine protease